jgi:MATE family multidrug resistance protein
MSSTYAHYQVSSSLPSDYAVLSELNNRHTHGSESDSGSDSVTDTDTDTIHPAVGRRRMHPKSLPHSRRPPTIGLHGHLSTRLASETTPLLSNPPVPRIEERVDNKDCRTEINLTLSMFIDEFLILAKYSLPIFGYCPFSLDTPRSHPFAGRTFLNILSSSSLSCPLVTYLPLHLPPFLWDL